MADLKIEIKGENQGAKKAFEEVSAEVKKLSNESKNFSSISNIAFGSFIGSLASQATMSAFGAFKNGIASSVEFLKESMKAAAESEVALNDLNRSLALSGRYSKEASDDFVAFAESLQATTTYEDDAIIKNAALLQSFGKLSNQGLKDATSAALDLAAVTGQDLNSAFSLLAKASVGSTEMLTRYGIVVKKTGDSSKDFEQLIKSINEQFGGSAQNKVMTYAGVTAQLANVISDTREETGKLLIQNPTAVIGISSLKDVFAQLNKAIKDNKELLQTLVTESLFTFIQLIPKVIDGVGKISSAFSTLSQYVNYFADILLSAQSKIIKFENATASFNANVRSLVGMNTKVYDDFIAKNEKQLAIIEKSREINAKDAYDKIKNQEKVNEAFGKFVDQSNKMIDNQYKKAINLSDKERENFLKNLSEKNKGAEAADKQAEERAKKQQELIEKNKKQIEEFRNAEQEYHEKLMALRKKQNEQISGTLSAGAFGAFSNKIDEENNLLPDQQKRLQANRAIGSGLGVAGNILGGASGAQDLLVGGASAVANMILPGLGQAVGPILDKLAQGPEAVKKFVEDFAQSAPKIVGNIIEALPAFGMALAEQAPLLLKSLADKLPSLINSFASQMPVVAVSLATSLAAQTPFIATTFAIEFVKNIPYIISSMASGVYNAIIGLFNSLNPFGGGGGGLFGFAEGGYIKKVPSGFPSDSFPASLTEGELIVDQTTSKKLEAFLNNASSIGGQGIDQILNILSNPMQIETSVEVNQQAFANIILNLTRQNRRLA